MNMVIFPIKMVIFPMKMVIFPIQMDEHGDFPYKNCDFPHENAGSFHGFGSKAFSFHHFGSSLAIPPSAATMSSAHVEVFHPRRCSWGQPSGSVGRRGSNLRFGMDDRMIR